MKQISRLETGFSTILIILLVAAIGIFAVVAFGVLDVAKFKKPDALQKVQVEDQQLKELNTLSTSDELPDIESDLTGTNFEEIDNEMDQVEKDLL